jgi:hypothetical protein
LHQRPNAEDDENPDSMKSESRNFEPDDPENTNCAGGEPAPVERRESSMLEIGSKKMKVNNPTDRQRFRNIEPEEPLHRRSA